MHDCWAYNPDARPTFRQLLAVFQHLATSIYENVEPPEVGATNKSRAAIKNGLVPLVPPPVRQSSSEGNDSRPTGNGALGQPIMELTSTNGS
ncbi:unnamed protein product [Echinostoma caproni]|uniref:PK_Tyr_Ser-Thr domain-containing protein n=1 Tax=Echinostoma caproni TaxID=27848 RepID=A0A183BCV3_9TREM|nr:unnamed protein product [Echinostoma caproni]